MSSAQLSEMTQSQRDRLAFIELRLRFVGEIRRQDLVARFGIQAAAATRCDTKDRELVNTHNLRLKACQDLGGCSASLPL